jgi:hypothetical protein
VKYGPIPASKSTQGTKIDKLHINQAIELTAPDPQTRFQIRLNVIIQQCDVKVAIAWAEKRKKS